MLAVTSMSYKFNIQGQYTRIMEANRGLRQRDLIVVRINPALHASDRPYCGAYQEMECKAFKLCG